MNLKNMMVVLPYLGTLKGVLGEGIPALTPSIPLVYFFPSVWIFTYNENMQATQRIPYLWDYDLDERQFQEILNGRLTKGRLNQDWATRRLLEYASYDEIIRLLGYKRLVENWSRWRGQIRSKSRVRGFDFLVKWIPEKHPELLRG